MPQKTTALTDHTIILLTIIWQAEKASAYKTTHLEQGPAKLRDSIRICRSDSKVMGRFENFRIARPAHCMCGSQTTQTINGA